MAKHIVCLTFDFDAMSGFISRGMTTPSPISRGEFGPNLANDSPIKSIADVLGHRYIDTTFIYAKADLKTLRQVAMPWPKQG